MPGPLAHRGGKAGPPPLPHRPAGAAVLRRFAAAPPAVDQAAALPPDVVRALRLIAAELRSMPRDCARDREELVFWHGRLARRLDAVVASKARTAASVMPVPLAPPERRPAEPGEASTPVSCLAATPAPRPRVGRRGPPWRAVPIAAAARRQAEAAGQLDLFR